MQGLFPVVEKLWPILKPFNSFFKSVAQGLFHICVVFVPIKSCFTKFLGGGGVVCLFVCLFVWFFVVAVGVFFWGGGGYCTWC